MTKPLNNSSSYSQHIGSQDPKKPVTEDLIVKQVVSRLLQEMPDLSYELHTQKLEPLAEELAGDLLEAIQQVASERLLQTHTSPISKYLEGAVQLVWKKYIEKDSELSLANKDQLKNLKTDDKNKKDRLKEITDDAKAVLKTQDTNHPEVKLLADKCKLRVLLEDVVAEIQTISSVSKASSRIDALKKSIDNDSQKPHWLKKVLVMILSFISFGILYKPLSPMLEANLEQTIKEVRRQPPTNELKAESVGAMAAEPATESSVPKQKERADILKKLAQHYLPPVGSQTSENNNKTYQQTLYETIIKAHIISKMPELAPPQAIHEDPAAFLPGTQSDATDTTDSSEGLSDIQERLMKIHQHNNYIQKTAPRHISDGADPANMNKS